MHTVNKLSLFSLLSHICCRLGRCCCTCWTRSRATGRRCCWRHCVRLATVVSTSLTRWKKAVNDRWSRRATSPSAAAVDSALPLSAKICRLQTRVRPTAPKPSQSWADACPCHSLSRKQSPRLSATKTGNNDDSFSTSFVHVDRIYFHISFLCV